jgi:HSP20 family protein
MKIRQRALLWNVERQIPLEGVEEDKAQAEFKNGVLTVTIPKFEQSKQNVKRIAINSN